MASDNRRVMSLQDGVIRINQPAMGPMINFSWLTSCFGPICILGQWGFPMPKKVYFQALTQLLPCAV